MAFTRLMRNLARDEHFGSRIVPIIPDEARTFGMDALFREFKIYASQGQKYEPVDHNLMLSYTEAADGQILEEGITEAGATASWIAAGTCYATRGVPMVPFYIFYSMFGFQRVGDLLWQAADSRTRGFLLGATAGRTTLLGEGLQHQDGHSLVLATTNPGVPGLRPGLRLRAGGHRQARHPPHVRAEHRRRRPRRLLLPHPLQRELPDARHPRSARHRGGDPPGAVPLAGRTRRGRRSGPRSCSPAPRRVAARKAAAELAEHYDVAAELWSATSYKALRDEALAVERWNRLHPGQSARTPLVDAGSWPTRAGPVVAVTDFMKLVPEQVARFVPDRPFVPLGTDGFGRSDTREALRRFFEVDAPHVVVAVLHALAEQGEVKAETVIDAINRYGIEPDAPNPAAG